MAAKGAQVLTLADVAKGKNKVIGGVAEVLMNQNAMLEDMIYTEIE